MYKQYSEINRYLYEKYQQIYNNSKAIYLYQQRKLQ
jgi:hypothetical protein